MGEVEAFDPEPSVTVAMDALAAVHTPFAIIGGLALDKKRRTVAQMRSLACSSP